MTGQPSLITKTLSGQNSPTTFSYGSNTSLLPPNSIPPSFDHTGSYDVNGNGDFTLTPHESSSNEETGDGSDIKSDHDALWQQALSMIPQSIIWDTESLTYSLSSSNGEDTSSDIDAIGPVTIYFQAHDGDMFNRLLQDRQAVEAASNDPAPTLPLTVSDFEQMGFTVQDLGNDRIELTRSEGTSKPVVTKHRYNLAQQVFEFSEIFVDGEQVSEDNAPVM
jgi:hypothetical protein